MYMRFNLNKQKKKLLSPVPVWWYVNLHKCIKKFWDNNGTISDNNII